MLGLVGRKEKQVAIVGGLSGRRREEQLGGEERRSWEDRWEGGERKVGRNDGGKYY